jgi:hypothetical protein
MRISSLSRWISSLFLVGEEEWITEFEIMVKQAYKILTKID